MSPKHLLILICSVALFQTAFAYYPPKDSLSRKTNFSLNIYPSTVFTGDLSLGAEFSYKRVRQELAVFYKTYQGWRGYDFDQGKRFNYYLRWDFVKRKNHSIGFGLCYQYLQRYYEDKVLPFPRMQVEMGSGDQNTPYYRSDEKQQLHGPGISIANLSRIYKNFFWGVNLDTYWVNMKHHYVAKEHVSGYEVTESIASGSGYYIEKPLNLPYTIKYERKRRFSSLLIKLAYQF